MAGGSAEESLDEVASGFTETNRSGGGACDRDDGARPRPDFQAYLHVVLMVLIRVDHGARGEVHRPLIAAADHTRAAVRPGRVVPGSAGLGEGRPGPLDSPGRVAAHAGGRLMRADQPGFFLGATKLGLVSHVGLFYATCPLVVLLLAWGFRMERPDFARLAGVLLSVAGIVVIGIGHYWERSSQNGDVAQSVVLSDLLLLGAVASWGGYIVVSKPLIVRHGAMTVLGGTVLTGFLMSVPFAFLELPSFDRA